MKLVVLALGCMVAVAVAQPKPKPPAQITVAEAKKLHAAKTAVFVDTRARGEFVKGHIKGAISIPAGDIPKRVKDIPAGKPVVLYDIDSDAAATELYSHGKTVVILRGGLAAWKLGGNPIATGSK